MAELRGKRDSIEACLNSLFAEAAFDNEGAWFPKGRHMKCERCLLNEVQYGAITDAMDIKVCSFCADAGAQVNSLARHVAAESKITGVPLQ